MSATEINTAEREIDNRPESVCRRCLGPNIVWSAPSPLWNHVMRGGDINAKDRFGGIICPICFATLAEEMGAARRWRFYAETVNVELATVTPSGRVWNPETWLWDEPAHSAFGDLTPAETRTAVLGGAVPAAYVNRPCVCFAARYHRDRHPVGEHTNCGARCGTCHSCVSAAMLVDGPPGPGRERAIAARPEAAKTSIDDAVANWHDGDGGDMTLHDYLSLTWTQYRRWAEKGVLPEGSRFVCRAVASVGDVVCAYAAGHGPVFAEDKQWDHGNPDRDAWWTGDGPRPGITDQMVLSDADYDAALAAGEIYERDGMAAAPTEVTR